MLTLNIEAPSFSELVQKAFTALGVAVSPAPSASQIGSIHKPYGPGATVIEPAAAPSPQAAETAPAAPVQVEQPAASLGAQSAPVASKDMEANSAEAGAGSAPKKRGRPRKESPVAGAVAEQANGPATQAAVVENTVSEPTVQSPAVEDAVAAPVAESAAPAAATAETPDPVLFEPTRGVLMAMVDRFKNYLDGNKHVYEIILRHGFTKVPQMKTGLTASVAMAIAAEASAVKGDK